MALSVSANEIIRSLTVGGTPIVEVVPQEVEQVILATFPKLPVLTCQFLPT